MQLLPENNYILLKLSTWKHQTYFRKLKYKQYIMYSIPTDTHVYICTLTPAVSVGRAQKEEERLRASIRRESQQRRMREKQHQRGLSSSYLEPDRYDDDDDGEEAVSLAAIKSKYKGGGALRGGWRRRT